MSDPELAPDFGELAACAGQDTDLFFPNEHGKGVGPVTERAKGICKRCPVRQECFDWALRRTWIQGIWGGTTGYERRQLRKNLRNIVRRERQEPAGHRRKAAG